MALITSWLGNHQLLSANISSILMTSRFVQRYTVAAMEAHAGGLVRAHFSSSYLLSSSSFCSDLIPSVSLPPLPLLLSLCLLLSLRRERDSRCRTFGLSSTMMARINGLWLNGLLNGSWFTQVRLAHVLEKRSGESAPPTPSPCMLSRLQSHLDFCLNF